MAEHYQLTLGILCQNNIDKYPLTNSAHALLKQVHRNCFRISQQYFSERLNCHDNCMDTE